jgi:isopentenyl-diphosphate delta-isomerase
MNQTEKRKQEHIDIAMKKDIAAHHNYWDDVILVHNALPEVDQHDIDLSMKLFDATLQAPLIISGMTGGFPEAKKINENLAAVAEKFQLGMGVGSQRAAIENPKLAETYNIINQYDIPLKIANIGASQLVLWEKEKLLYYAQTMVDMIEADLLAVCLNFLQEAVQPEGEAHAKGCLDALHMITDEFNIPVIIKESGAGISYPVAEKLAKTYISGIDVGGMGGTSFSAVEYYRAEMKEDKHNMRIGKTFWDWGIPTPDSILHVGQATKWMLPIIATGGIRHGLDAAKALAMGASAAGIAHTVLLPALKSRQDVMFELEVILKELRTAMFLVGIDKAQDMKRAAISYDPQI